MCDILSTLEGEAIAGVVRYPKTVPAARENVEKALSILRRKRQIPTTLLWSGEEIVKGNDTVLWDLVWHIMKAYPTPASLRNVHGRLRDRVCTDPRCIYDGEQLRRLEVFP